MTGGAHTPVVRRAAKVLSKALLLLLFLGVSSRVCEAQRGWPLWKSYTAKFLDASGRIIDRGAADSTTSEGQAYAMFFALVANDRSAFDRLLRWTEDNLASGDLTSHLPAWKWGKNPNSEWKQLDTNSASDADLWFAYDCLEAGRLWRDERLRKLGETLASQIRHAEVGTLPNGGTVLLSAPSGFKLPDGSYVLNASYTPPQVLARLRLADPSGPWKAIAETLPTLVAKSAPAGFVSDWLQAGNSFAPAVPPDSQADGKPSRQPVGSYDAIRVYLWLGMADRSTPGVAASLGYAGAMAAYLKKNAVPPLSVDSTGRVIDPAGPVGFSAAVSPYLLALGRRAEAAAQRNRLQASADPATGLYGRDARYYDQNLALFATGWSEQRFRFDRDGRLKVQWR